jgi:N-acetylmuramoyl-L-alanine amidase
VKYINNPSPNFSERASTKYPKGAEINSIVLHYTGMETAKTAIDKMCNPQYEVSCHYCVDYNGDVYKLVDESKKAWHAGVSWWREEDNININSVGIEIVNKGHECSYEIFPEAQIQAVIALCKDIKNRHKIDDRWVVGHSDVAPNRKEDPGELFPWQKLAMEGIGLWHDEADLISQAKYDNHFFTISDIINAKIQLAEIGYYIHPSDALDEQFKYVLTAFYRRFWSDRIIIQENKRHPKNIHLDGKAIKLIEAVAKLYK